jgi:hypothetical protein
MPIPPDDWPRVRALFEQALTLPVPARSQYVSDACGSSTAVRREVERMLASHEQATGFLETPIAVSLADVDVTSNLEGATIGPYL